MADFESLSGPMNCSSDFLVCLSMMYLYGRLKKYINERFKSKVTVDLDHHISFLAYWNQFSSVFYSDGCDFIRNIFKNTTVLIWRKTFANLLNEALFSAFLQAKWSFVFCQTFSLRVSRSNVKKGVCSLH